MFGEEVTNSSAAEDERAGRCSQVCMMVLIGRSGRIWNTPPNKLQSGGPLKSTRWMISLLRSFKEKGNMEVASVRHPSKRGAGDEVGLEVIPTLYCDM